MKRIAIFALVMIAMAAALLVYGRGQAQRGKTQVRRDAPVATLSEIDRLTPARIVGSQQRINRYFHGNVVPKLKSCWSRVQGRGLVEMKYNYTRSGGGAWVFNQVEVDRSTLPSGQDAVALKCMQDAARGTNFAASGDDGASTTYTVNWSWPVPFPANSAQLTSAMFAARANNGGGGRGGCDGAGTQAKCYTCSSDGHACEKVCVGYTTCAVTYPGALCGASGKCASGGPFGISGGVIIY